MKKAKYWYVVWMGRETGVFESWDDCKKQVIGYTDAKYMKFLSKAEAEEAFSNTSEKYIVKNVKHHTSSLSIGQSSPLQESICVDAACSVEKQIMEYRGVYFKDAKVIFHKGPFEGASNNIGEFLAIVHAFSYMKKAGIKYPVYSDSKTAIGWVEKKIVNTKIEPSKIIIELIERALTWLQNNTEQYVLLKWDTKSWGEIPADFGRK